MYLLYASLSCLSFAKQIKDWQDAWHDERNETENQGTDLHGKLLHTVHRIKYLHETVWIRILICCQLIHLYVKPWGNNGRLTFSFFEI